MELLIATKNLGKVKELKSLLSETSVVARSLMDFPHISEPEETGATFAENAILKANYYATQSGLWALADDSGLEVKALNGAPGVFSARYAGNAAGDAEKISKLLSEIAEAKNENRTARFVCAAAVANSKGNIKFSAEGVCNGQIAFEPRGKNGFGYDPVFIPEGFSETFGELSEAVKQEISHRSRAMQKIIAYLRSLTAV